MELQVLSASNDDEVEARADEALATRPNLVVAAGTGMVDVLWRSGCGIRHPRIAQRTPSPPELRVLCTA
jgi:hypothetical protein